MQTSAMTAPRSERLWVPGDWNAFFGFGTNILVNVLVLTGLVEEFGQQDFTAGQIAATIVAMGSNFLLNNEITYSAYRYRGVGMIGGFLLFALLCSVGAIANLDIAGWRLRGRSVWWVAGLAGALVSVVWNYAASATFVWRRRRVG